MTSSGGGRRLFQLSSRVTQQSKTAMGEVDACHGAQVSPGHKIQLRNISPMAQVAKHAQHGCLRDASAFSPCDLRSATRTVLATSFAIFAIWSFVLRCDYNRVGSLSLRTWGSTQCCYSPQRSSKIQTAVHADAQFSLSHPAVSADLVVNISSSSKTSARQ